MLLVPISKLQALNWKIEVVPIEEPWVMDHSTGGHRLTGLPDPVDPSEPVTLHYLLQGFTGFTGYIPDEGAAVKAHHVDWGCEFDQVNAGDVPYCNNPAYVTIEEALDHLLYSPLVITFNNSVGTVEIGSVVNSVGLSWSYNKADVTSQSINQGIGSLPIGDRAYTHSSSFMADRTYTLTASDGTQIPTRNTLVLFRHYRYWGPSANTPLTDAQIIALSSKEFSITQAKAEFEITCVGEYIYYVYPESFGVATFQVNGMLNTAWTLTTRNFVNASGNTTPFRIYQSNNKLTGTYRIIVI